MALITAQDYIYQALRRCGQLRPGAIANADLLSDALDQWAIMFSGFNAKRTMQFTMPDYVFPIPGPGHGQTGNGQSFSGSGFQIGLPISFTATTTSASPILTAVSNVLAVQQGEAISGIGIPLGTTVVSVNPATSTIVMSTPATANGTVTVTGTPDFVAPRPDVIVRVNLYLTTANPSQPTRIPLRQISMEEWLNIPVIDLPPINVATTFAYDPQYPNGVLWVWPPLNGNSLEIFTWGQLAPPLSLSAAYSAPPGYAEVIIWELAKAMYGMATRDVWIHKMPFQYIAGQAAIAKAAVKAVNAPMPRLRNDFSGGSGGGANTSDWDLLLTGVPY